MWSSRHSAKKHYLSGALPFNQKIESKIIRKFRQKSVRRLLPVSRGTFQRYSSIYVVWTVGTGEISVPFITEFPVSSFLIKRKRSALSFDCFANFWKKKPYHHNRFILTNSKQSRSAILLKKLLDSSNTPQLKWPLVSWQQHGWRLYLRVQSLSRLKNITATFAWKLPRFLCTERFLLACFTFCRLQVSRTKIVQFEIIATTESIVLKFKGIDVIGIM